MCVSIANSTVKASKTFVTVRPFFKINVRLGIFLDSMLVLGSGLRKTISTEPFHVHLSTDYVSAFNLNQFRLPDSIPWTSGSLEGRLNVFCELMRPNPDIHRQFSKLLPLC